MPVAFDYHVASERVKEALRAEFPHDTVATTEGWNGRVHVTVVSERFNRMGPEDRQQYVYDILRDRLDADSQAVSLVKAYGTDDL